MEEIKDWNIADRRHVYWEQIKKEFPKFKMKAVCRYAGIAYATYRGALWKSYAPREETVESLMEAIEHIKHMPLEQAREYVNMSKASKEVHITYGRIANWAQGKGRLSDRNKQRIRDWLNS
jgi:hypothetical protein